MIDDNLIRKKVINRRRRWLGLETTKIVKRDFFEDTNRIYLGTRQPWDSYETNEKENWYGVKLPSEFTWMFWSSAGTYKSKLIQTILPYFFKKGYYICIIEAKDDTLSMSLRKSIKTHRIHPDAYNVDIPIVSHIPSYAISDNLSTVDKIAPSIVKRFDKKVTIKSSSITNALEWRTLFKASDTGADIIHLVNKECNGNLLKMEKRIRGGYFVDDKGKRVSIHYGAKQSINRVLESIKMDEFLNAKKYEEINLEKIWEAGKVATICFFQKRTQYMKIYVQKIIEQQYAFSMKMKKEHGKDIKILNIYDDCQLYLNTQADENNPANAAVKNSIRMGRAAGFNSIFAVQDILDFNIGIYGGCKDIFVGYVRNFGVAHMLPIHKERIEQNRTRFKEIPLPSGYTRKEVCYYHIPTNDNLATSFFPGDPLSGGW